MNDDGAHPLRRRLEKLERRTRLLGTGLLILLVGMSLSMASDAPPEVLSARSLRMVDEENRVRAELGIDEDGSAGLFLRDEEGRLRAAMVHDDAQTALFLYDSDGAVRVGAAQFAHGGGGFALHGDQGKGAAILYLKNRRGLLSILDENGEVLHRIPEAKPTPPPKDE